MRDELIRNYFAFHLCIWVTAQERKRERERERERENILK
jgi:hypothetical protein